MKKDDAIRYAKSLQESLGNNWTTYTAADAPEIYAENNETWAVIITTKIDDWHNETKYTRECDLIHYLIGYAGESQRQLNQ